MSETILVTGSSRGIGKAIALRLAQSGFDIVVHCRSRIEEAEEIAQSIRELGRQARVFIETKQQKNYLRMLNLMVLIMALCSMQD